LPQKIIFNSKTGANDHCRMGYRRDKSCIIPNGFDTKLFSPSVEESQKVRLELNIPEDAILIGLIGRFESFKRSSLVFLKAGEKLLSNKREIIFLISRTRCRLAKPAIKAVIEKLGISEKVVFAWGA
jgi:hypothetical protein